MRPRAPHPALAALYRAGSSASRTAAALQRAQAKTDFAALSLENHPLAAAPSWAGLVARPSADAHVAATLAHLARDDAASQPTFRSRPLPGAIDFARTISEGRDGAMPSLPTRGKRSFAQDSAGSSASARATITPDPTRPDGPHMPEAADAELLQRGPSRQRDTAGGRNDAQTPAEPGPGSRSADQVAASHRAVERALREYDPATSDQRLPQTASGEDRAAPLHRASATKSESTAPSLLTRLSEQSRAAAARPVQLAGPAARQAAIERILRGEAAVPVGGTSAETTESDHQIETALARLRAGTSPGPASPVDPSIVAPVGSSAAIPTGPVRSMRDEPPQEPARAPRNGIERLLQRAKRQNLVAEGQSQGDQARLSTEPADLPDLAQSRRASRETPPPARLDADQVAQAVTDLLRREARAAGIDLKGGRS